MDSSNLRVRKSSTPLGGAMGIDEVVGDYALGLVADTQSSDRLTGARHLVKVFMANNSSQTLYDSKVFLDNVAQGTGEDVILIAHGTALDTNADFLASTPKYYGMGSLSDSVSAEATTMHTIVLHPEWLLFATGDVVRITDKANTESTTGNEEYVELGEMLTSVSGVQSFTLVTPLKYAYPVGAKVSSCIVTSELKASVLSKGFTPASGRNLNDTLVVPSNLAGTSDIFTFEWLTDTTFKCTGAKAGYIGSGSRYSTFEPVNPNYAAPYFSIPSETWVGTWVTGATAYIELTASAVPVWIDKRTPVATTVIGEKSFDLIHDGEQA